MAGVKCAGLDVLRGRVSLPTSGAWTAELFLDADEAPNGQVTIAADDGIGLIGTVVPGRAGVEQDVAHVLVVGGSGGLAVEVAGAYRNAKFRDPLGAIARASGEALDDAISPDVLGIDLPFYTLGRYGAGRALGELATIAGMALGADVRWRITPGGKVWIGEEAWPSAALPSTDEILETFPAEGRIVIGAATPSLLPGVDLAGAGRVSGVEHVLSPSQVRTWAWLTP